jgi:hypothetical protein
MVGKFSLPLAIFLVIGLRAVNCTPWKSWIDMDKEFTLRDHFAIASMPLAERLYIDGIPEHIIRHLFGDRNGLKREEIIASLAYVQADAMLKAREVKR